MCLTHYTRKAARVGPHVPPASASVKHKINRRSERGKGLFVSEENQNIRRWQRGKGRTCSRKLAT